MNSKLKTILTTITLTIALATTQAIALAYTIPGTYQIQNHDTALIQRLEGQILLQVEQHGEAWYVNKADSLRYYMKDGDAAYQMMREFSLGITDEDLSKIPQINNAQALAASKSICQTNELANRLKGQILLQTEQHGEAYYIHPKKCSAIYMKDGSEAYQLMRYLGLGITDADLSKIPADTDETRTVTKTDNAQGNIDDAKIIMVEYIDLECPYCQRNNKTMKAIKEKYGKDVVWVIRHFPLSMHRNALPAAIASQCAAEQGKFWEMEEKLISPYNRLGQSQYNEIAKELNLDIDKFTSCMQSDAKEDEINKQIEKAKKYGVIGTPTTFINGDRVPGAIPQAAFEEKIEQVLNN